MSCFNSNKIILKKRYIYVDVIENINNSFYFTVENDVFFVHSTLYVFKAVKQTQFESLAYRCAKFLYNEI